MLFNPWTFVFEVVNFLALMVILKRFVYDPLHRAVDARRVALAQVEAAAQADQQQALALQQQLTAEIAGIEQQREQMLQQAHLAIAEGRARAQVALAEEAAHQRVAAERELADLRRHAVTELREDLVAMSVELVERLLREISDTTLHQQLCRHLIDELQTPVGDGVTVLQSEPGDGTSVVLEAGQEIDPATLAQVTAAVAARLGQPVAPDVRVTPALISGLRVQIGGQVWDASLAGLLDASRQSLGAEVSRRSP